MTDYPSDITPDYSTPIEVNETTKANNINIENPPPSILYYKTPYNTAKCITFFTIIIIGIFELIITLPDFMNNNKKSDILLFSLIFQVFTLVGFIFALISQFYVIIKIDNNLGIIMIKQRKIICCFKKTKKIQINDIDEISIEKDCSSYYANGKPCGSFKINILLNNGRQINVCRDAVDKYNASKKALNFLKKGLPQNILILGNLAYQ